MAALVIARVPSFGRRSILLSALLWPFFLCLGPGHDFASSNWRYNEGFLESVSLRRFFVYGSGFLRAYCMFLGVYVCMCLFYVDFICFASSPRNNNHLQPRWFKVTFLIPLLVGGHQQPGIIWFTFRACLWNPRWISALAFHVNQLSATWPKNQEISPLLTGTTKIKSSKEKGWMDFAPKKKIRHRVVGLTPPIFGGHVVPIWYRDHFHTPSACFL